MAVALGVAFGISLGIVKIIFAVPIAYLVIPGYVLAIFLTFLSSEEFVNVAWDSAGVTTGPVTVPLVLAMGLGFGNSVDAIEGFGRDPGTLGDFGSGRRGGKRGHPYRRLV